MYNYQVLKRIGGGSQGTIFKAKKKNTNKTVALKKIKCETEEILNKNLQEVQAVLCVSSPYIVKCSGFFIQDPNQQLLGGKPREGTNAKRASRVRARKSRRIQLNTTPISKRNFGYRNLIIEYEYCDSGSLYEVLRSYRRRNRLVPIRDIMRWFNQMLDAMVEIQRRNIIHRDLKPDNIFLKNHMREVRIGDFGFAKKLRTRGQKTRTFLGTQNFIAPEIKRKYDSPYSDKVDIWGIGAIVLDLLLPKTIDFAYEITNDREDVFKCVAERYDHKIANLVAKIMIVDPDKRPTVNQILTFLNRSSLVRFTRSPTYPLILQKRLLTENLKWDLDKIKIDLFLVKMKSLIEKATLQMVEIIEKNKKYSKMQALRKGLGKELYNGHEMHLSTILYPTSQFVRGSRYFVNIATWKLNSERCEVLIKTPIEQYANLDLFLKKKNYYLIRKLVHPSLEQVFGYFRKTNSYFLVCSSFSGISLRNILKTAQRVTLKQVICLSFEISKGLLYLSNFNGKSYVHPKLKPDNIIVNKTLTQVKLIDLECVTENNTSSDLVGLPCDYRSPKFLDICDDGDDEDGIKKFSTRDQVYSFGCLMEEIYQKSLWEWDGGKEESLDTLNRMFKTLVIKCLLTNSKKRPSLVEVAYALYEVKVYQMKQKVSSEAIVPLLYITLPYDVNRIVDLPRLGSDGWKMLKMMIHPELGVGVKDVSVGFKIYKDCFLGRELVDWIIRFKLLKVKGCVGAREMAIDIAKLYHRRGAFACVSCSKVFSDSGSYVCKFQLCLNDFNVM